MLSPRRDTGGLPETFLVSHRCLGNPRSDQNTAPMSGVVDVVFVHSLLICQ
ncbi:hypothetical protein Sjap_015406 [Stephania japonica]|uniref:Uncharacterized protein n=1 Tax=Stephania japonica TaxID=461633 RepID=A0AAP0IJ35_9MAGN